MSKERIQRLLDREATLTRQRDLHASLWEDLAKICFPRSASIYALRNAPVTPGEDRRTNAVNSDGTAMRAMRVLATGQAARITPMGGRWFVLRPPENLSASQQAMNWYGRCTEILAAMLAGSNFYNRAYQCYENRGGFGISALETTAGAKGKGLHFRSLPVGSFSIAENSLDEVDTVFRSYHWTPAQCVEAFPDTVPESVRKLADNAETRDVKSERIVQAVYPRTERDPRRADSRNKPIASEFIQPDTLTQLSESGFDSMPVAVSRWATTPLSPYGWGPADYALPEASQANHMEAMQDVLAETSAFPRLLYPAGMKDDIDFGPQGLTPFDPNNPADAQPREWMTSGRYDIWKDRAQDKKKAIEEAFFVELFTAISRLPSDATATQVSAIVSESRELFHPIYSNMVREFLTPTLRRCFTLAMQQGVMPPPPASVIQQDDLGAFIADPDVEYVTSMALALEESQLRGFDETLATIAPLAQVDPAWLDPLNPETIVPHLMRAKGLPVSFLRTPEQLAQLAQSRAMQSQAQAALAATQGVKNLGGIDEAQRAAGMMAG